MVTVLGKWEVLFASLLVLLTYSVLYPKSAQELSLKLFKSLNPMVIDGFVCNSWGRDNAAENSSAGFHNIRQSAIKPILSHNKISHAFMVDPTLITLSEWEA
ncbi:MAG: hypothetical protein HBSIN02_25020 [Bacteroidia bacterium]|nr:MAG: hypothetical protein HBSIN02_25020 [Bacteroidia bacterium]